jgi:hypothetical protein
MPRASRVLVASVIALSGSGFAQAQSAATDDVSELRQLTERRFAANAANDRPFYERLIAENALILLPNRRPLTKRAYLDHEFLSRRAGYHGASATVHDFRAVVDRDSAVVSYLAVEPTALGDQTFEVRTGRIDTYIRLKGEWRLLSMAMMEVPSWPDAATIDPKLYSDYAGTYQLSPDIFVVVTNEDGHLMSAMTGQDQSELFPENATTFFDRTDSPLARTIFERDSSGNVVAQIYRSHGQRIRARKIK